jgi:hypothetical protein
LMMYGLRAWRGKQWPFSGATDPGLKSAGV